MKKFLEYKDLNANLVKSNEYESLNSKFLHNTLLGRFFLFFLTRRIFSKMVGLFLSSRLSRIKIKSFIKKNKIDMSTYENIKYKSFNEFFSRKKKEEYLSFNSNQSDLVSPCDSKLEVFKISDDLILDIKNSKYYIKDLLKNEELSLKYKGGYALVFRLCVTDYHRYLFIDDGTITLKKYIKGRLNTVRPIAVRSRKVYTENAREYSILKTSNFGDVCQIEVGAMCVGKIVNHDVYEFKRYDEKGYFKFGGSTIVLLFEKDIISLDETIIKNSHEGYETVVKVGDKIGKRMA